jgi:hypothetical protein
MGYVDTAEASMEGVGQNNNEIILLQIPSP